MSRLGVYGSVVSGRSFFAVSACVVGDSLGGGAGSGFAGAGLVCCPGCACWAGTGLVCANAAAARTTTVRASVIGFMARESLSNSGEPRYPRNVAEDLYQTLMRFHREIAL